VRRYLILLILVAIVTLAVFAAGRADVAETLTALVTYVRGAGALGIALFAAAYVASAVALLPGAALTLAAGFVYGPLLGTVIVSPVSVVAATCAFLLGRTVARDWIGRRVADQPRFAAVDEAVGRQGFKIVALLRLSPLFPFNLLNYALGLTKVRLRDYVLASWLGMLPGTALYVYLGSLVTNVGDLLTRPAAGSQPPAAQWLYWGGFAATLVVAVLVTHTARQALAQALEQGDAAPRPSPETLR
jgi:uncharacterized membrane protein YdjX (TVP38/TMEM64 family)